MFVFRIMVLLLVSCTLVGGAEYRITGILPASGGGPNPMPRFAAGSTINGQPVGGQFASRAQARAFIRLSTSRRYALPATIQRSQRLNLRRREPLQWR